MFATFTILERDSSIDTVVVPYSRLYLYGFISLFILSRTESILSVILDAYDTIKVCNSRIFCPRIERFV